MYRQWLIRAAALALALGIGIGVGFGAGAQEVPEKGENKTLKVNEVMRVGDKIITAEQLLARIWDYENMLKPNERVLTPSLTYLRDTALLELEGKRMSFSVTQAETNAETDKQLARIKEELRIKTRGMVPYEKWLQEQNLTQEQFENYVRERAHLILEKRVLVGYFEETTESLEASHILHRKESDAKATYDMLKSTDANKLRDVFEDLAVQRSIDPSAGVTKGRLPRLYQQDGTLVKPAEDAIWALKNMQYSTPVQSDFGWHIFARWQTFTPEKKPLADLREALIKSEDKENDTERFNRWVRWVFNTQKYPMERRLPGWDTKADKP